jgi:hypothetical protein
VSRLPSGASTQTFLYLRHQLGATPTTGGICPVCHRVTDISGLTPSPLIRCIRCTRTTAEDRTRAAAADLMASATVADTLRTREEV